MKSFPLTNVSQTTRGMLQRYKETSVPLTLMFPFAWAQRGRIAFLMLVPMLVAACATTHQSPVAGVDFDEANIKTIEVRYFNEPDIHSYKTKTAFDMSSLYAGRDKYEEYFRDPLMEQLRSRGYVVKEGLDIPIIEEFEPPSWGSGEKKVFDQYIQSAFDRVPQNRSVETDAILVYALSASLDRPDRRPRSHPPGYRSTDKLVVGENSRYWLYSPKTRKTVLSNRSSVSRATEELSRPGIGAYTDPVARWRFTETMQEMGARSVDQLLDNLPHVK